MVTLRFVPSQFVPGNFVPVVFSPEPSFLVPSLQVRPKRELSGNGRVANE
jgi:hypothetical protein